MCIEPSGVFCSSCKGEVDLFDGPIRMLGGPSFFPFCWICFQELYRSGYMPQCDILAEERDDGRLYVWMEDSDA